MSDFLSRSNDDIYAFERKLIYVSILIHVYLFQRPKNKRKTTYSLFLSIDDDPDNTVSIMLDGVESRLHIINIDIDYVCIFSNRFILIGLIF